MQAPPTPDTPENWNAASLGYAEHVAPRMMEAYADEFADRLDLDSSTEALEVAAGSGALTHVLAKRVKSLLATDFAADMIAILRDRMRAHPKSLLLFERISHSLLHDRQIGMNNFSRQKFTQIDKAIFMIFSSRIHNSCSLFYWQG